MSTQQEPVRIVAPASRRLLVLCAFLLILAQAFLVVHSIDHLAGVDGESCQVCLLGGGLEHAAVDTSGPDLAIHPAPTEGTVQAPSWGAGRIHSFRQRDPPHSPNV